jgi:sarcosine oxidase delta subunit
MDGCARWVNLAREVVARHVADANLVDLQGT